MTREEQIVVAFNDYSDTRKLSTSDDFEYTDIQVAFEEGAMWADKHHKSPWISVDDDLPCNHEDMIALVNTLCKNTYNVLVRFDYGGTSFAYMYCSDYKQNWHWSEISTITHWMPIPKLPKE